MLAFLLALLLNGDIYMRGRKSVLGVLLKGRRKAGRLGELLFDSV